MREALDDQISRQKSEIEVLGDKLKTKIKEAVQEKIRTQLYGIVEACVGEKVEEKVREQVRCFESRTVFCILISSSFSSVIKYPKIFVSKSSNTDGRFWKLRQNSIMRECSLIINYMTKASMFYKGKHDVIMLVFGSPRQLHGFALFFALSLHQNNRRLS